MGPSGNDGAMRTPRGGAEGGMEVRRAASLCPRRLPSGLASRRVALRFVPPPSSGRVPQAPQGDGFPEGEAKWNKFPEDKCLEENTFEITIEIGYVVTWVSGTLWGPEVVHEENARD